MKAYVLDSQSEELSREVIINAPTGVLMELVFSPSINVATASAADEFIWEL
jgi:hypothetical protein